MKKYFLVLLILFLCHTLYGQDQLGIPQIVNYTNENYNAGIQNWDVKQDKNDILYFGNNEGLLTFNGRYWNLYKLPNYTAVRSIGIDSKNRIFVGGQDEIGYFFPDAHGILKYTSLLPLVPEQFRKFADIWNISILNDEVFFRSKTVILHFKDGIIKTYKPNVSWEFLGQADHQLFAHALDGRLMIYDKEVWKPYCTDPVLKHSAISAILPYHKDTLLVSTLKNGLFLLYNHQLLPKHTPLDSVFLNDRIYLASKTNDDRYLTGTTSGGVYMMNKQGKFIQNFNYKGGLQNNNIRGILIDHDKNMWLALDDGIAFVAINSAVKSISPDRNKQVTSYAFSRFNQRLYIGTSNGLYATKIPPGIQDLSLAPANFKEVKNAKGQVWSLNEINSQLLMAHEDGTFIINNDVANPLYGSPGTWRFQALSNVLPAHDILAGTYLGLQKIGYTNGIFTNMGKVEGITESLRFIVVDNNEHIWSSHPYHGVYKMEMFPGQKKIRKVTLFSKKEGLPSNLHNYVYKIKNRIVIATIDGIYEYDPKSNRFIRFKLLNKALSGIPVQYLKEDDDGNIWFVTNKKVGVIDFSKPTASMPFSLFHLPELDGKVAGGFESIYTLNNENIFIGANKGAYHVNYKRYVENITRPTVIIGSVKLLGTRDSLVFGGYFTDETIISLKQDLSQIPEFSNRLNSIHFEFSSTRFEQQKNIEFSYQLAGFDKDWSPWIKKSEKEYTNLSAGKYSFKVKARTSADDQSEIVSYTFKILPAWYDTIWMKLVYLILILLTLRAIVKWQKRKYKKEKDRLSYLHQLELDRTEKEIVRLKYEKLEADVNYKNKELSTVTMHLVQRGKVLAKIKEVISSVLKNHDISDSSSSFKHLIRLIRDVEKGDQELDHLTMHFNNVNAEFFNKLKDRYKELSQNDLKFCAYLKMNLSSKEMAQVMNVTIKAVEVGRYRLRKKLHLQPETNLYEFLISLSRDKAP